MGKKAKEHRRRSQNRTQQIQQQRKKAEKQQRMFIEKLLAEAKAGKFDTPTPLSEVESQSVTETPATDVNATSEGSQTEAKA